MFRPMRLDGEAAALVWDKVAPILADPVARGGAVYTLDDVRDLVTAPDGRWSLWIMVDEERREIVGAWTTNEKSFPGVRVLDVPHLGGARLRDWYGAGMALMDEFARARGCRLMRCVGRKGWQAFGWKPVATLFEREVA